MLQSTKFKFNSSEVDPKCPLCFLESEELQHLNLSCRERTLLSIPKKSLSVIGAMGDDICSQHFHKQGILVALVVDCQKLVNHSMTGCCRVQTILCVLELCAINYTKLIRLKLHKELRNRCVRLPEWTGMGRITGMEYRNGP